MNRNLCRYNRVPLFALALWYSCEDLKAHYGLKKLVALSLGQTFPGGLPLRIR